MMAKFERDDYERSLTPEMEKHGVASVFEFTEPGTLKILSYHYCRLVYTKYKSKFSWSSYLDYRPTSYAKMLNAVFYIQISILREPLTHSEDQALIFSSIFSSSSIFSKTFAA